MEEIVDRATRRPENVRIYVRQCSEAFATEAACEYNQPIKRMGTTDEIANAIMFMSSDECNYMIGANIIVDGGITLRMHENDDTGAG